MHEDADRHRGVELDLGALIVNELEQRRRENPPVREPARPLVVLLHEEPAVLELQPEQVGLPAAEATVVVGGQLSRFRTNGRMPPAL